MKLLATLVASCFLTLCALEADASVVNFTGVIANGAGSMFGSPPDPDVPFTMSVTFDDSTPITSTGTITGITFDTQSPAHHFDVTGGLITVTDAGSTDTASFVINVTGAATGLLTFTFTRDAIASSTADQASVRALTLGNTTNSFQAILGAAGTYSGSITGVPEPSSCLALLSLVGGGAWRWRRSRQQRTAV